MASQKYIKQMQDYVIGCMEESGKFRAVSTDGNGILISQVGKDDPAKMYIFTHANPMTIKNYNSKVNALINNEFYVSNVFDKGTDDQKGFMVRLDDSARKRGDKSLKRYNTQELNAMISLRGLEKEVLSLQRPINALTYYQPETERLNESLRQYNMKNVELNYSHIRPDQRAFDFVENRTSLDYKIAEELESGNEFIDFRKPFEKSKIRHIVPKQ